MGTEKAYTNAYKCIYYLFVSFKQNIFTLISYVVAIYYLNKGWLSLILMNMRVYGSQDTTHTDKHPTHITSAAHTPQNWPPLNPVPTTIKTSKDFNCFVYKKSLPLVQGGAYGTHT